MGGILSLRPKHYLASGHDVLHLSPHLSAMTEQQGYACCYPDGKNHGAKPLHFVVKVGSHGVTFFLDEWHLLFSLTVSPSYPPSDCTLYLNNL